MHGPDWLPGDLRDWPVEYPEFEIKESSEERRDCREGKILQASCIEYKPEDLFEVNRINPLRTEPPDGLASLWTRGKKTSMRTGAKDDAEVWIGDRAACGERRKDKILYCQSSFRNLPMASSAVTLST
ncbi:hypothetical protein AVEN_115289-1 [Araneus ventricosus]|uniref:Uncharacterized protein n=1 Tax=Araneus ventricosus TaxID=182803 RepID=A0A4Y1ZY63_ARAVE|nr:hypothetical protein AVEN_115289-1 [Araneus ventricosus]